MLSDSESSDSDNGIRFKTASTRNKDASFGGSGGGGGGGGGGTSGSSSSNRNTDSKRHSSSRGNSSYNDHRYDVNWKHSASSSRSSTNDHRYNNSPDRKSYDHRKKDDHRRRSASYERRRFRSRSKDRHSQHTGSTSSSHRNKRSRSKEAVPATQSLPPPPPPPTTTTTTTTTTTSIAQRRDDSINDDIKEISIKKNSSPKEISINDDDKQQKVKKAKHKKHKKGKKNEERGQITIKSKSTIDHKSIVTLKRSPIVSATTKSSKTTDSHHTELLNGRSSSSSSSSASSIIVSDLQIESINNVDSKIVCGPSLPPNFKLNRSSSKSPIISTTSTPPDTPIKMVTTNIESSISPLSNTPPPPPTSSISTNKRLSTSANIKNINVSSATTSSCSSTSTLNLELLADDHIKHLMSDISDDSELDDINLIGPLPPGTHSNSETVLQLEKRALELKLAKLKYDDDDEDDNDDDGVEGDDGKDVDRNHLNHHHRRQHHHHQTAKHREEWMIELPDIKAVADFGLGSRQFRTKERPDFSDRSSWTDTPQKKHSHKLNSGDDDVKKMSRDELRLQKEKQANATYIAKRDSEQEKAAKHHKRKHKRDESLLDIHRKKLKDKKVTEDKKSERRPFSRENDLKVNKFDQKQKNALIKKAQLLDTRFGRGESKYL